MVTIVEHTRHIWIGTARRWRRKSYPALLCHMFVRLPLLLFAISHVHYLTSRYFSDSTTVVTNASFYNEGNPVEFPHFLLCFAKVFTYSKLREADIQHLYSPGLQNDALDQENSTYRWKIDLNDLVLAVEFNNHSYRPGTFFENTFYLPTQSCWRARQHSFKIGQAGQVFTVNLYINAAVYDDLATYYDSPLTYLTIVPYTRSDHRHDVVPHFRSSVSISPGRFSAVGFHLKQIDSTHRSKHDARKCVRTKDTKEHCISTQYRKMLDTKCNVAISDSISSLVNFGTCGIHESPDTKMCLFESCTENVFYFTKSEAYIKFDTKLSALRATPAYLIDTVAKISRAKSLDTKHNPVVIKEFREIASTMDELSQKAATALSKTKGFKCTALLTRKIRLRNTADAIPSVTAEREFLTSQMQTFVARFDRTFRRLLNTIMGFGARSPLFQHHTPLILPVSIENTGSPNTNQELKNSIRLFGGMLETVATTMDILEQESVTISESYKNLLFTKFIEEYSSYGMLEAYQKLLKIALNSINLLKKLLFEGNSASSQPFAHQDEQLKTTYIRTPRFSAVSNRSVVAAVVDAYPHDELTQYAWLLNKGFIHVESEVQHPVFEAVLDNYPTNQRVPIMADLFCRLYSNYLETAERYHGCEKSFSLSGSSARFQMTERLRIFFLDALLDEYDHEMLFVVKYDGLDGALRRSCLRREGYPVYANKSATYEQMIFQFDAIRHRYYGSYTESNSHMVSDRVRLTMKLITTSMHAFTLYTTESKNFLEYYKTRVIGSFGSIIGDVENLKSIHATFRKFRLERQNYKRFLVNRLQTTAQLIHGALNGEGEKHVSHYLDKKGTILIGEVRLEAAAVIQELQSAKIEFSYFKSKINSVSSIYKDNSSMEGAIMHAVMSANFHPSPKIQRWILHTLSRCNRDRWKSVERDLSHRLSILVDWLKNSTSLVVRAKRYVDSLHISKSLLRKNMMHVSLYYDSMTVLTETNEPSYKTPVLVSNLGAVLRIYLRMNTFRIINTAVHIIMLALSCFQYYM